MIKAVIFDMDGVLFDSHDAWFKVFNRTRKHFNLPEISEEEFNKYFWAVDSRITIPKYFKGKSVEEVVSYYNQIFFDFLTDIKLTKNVKETLKKLGEKGLVLVVATNTFHKQAERTLKRSGLLGYFKFVVGADDVKIGKPEPDIIFKAINDLGLNINEVVFIGDTEIDMETCKNAKCKTIGFKINGDIRIERFKDILKVI